MSRTHIELASLALAAAGLVGGLLWIARKRRSTPEKRERQRRLRIHETGRLGDAFLTEIDENFLYYTYSIRGVQYMASQDVTTLRERLPEDLNRLIGPSSMKYASQNPANSILLCEEWSGLRIPAGTNAAKDITAGDAPGGDPAAQRTVTL